MIMVVIIITNVVIIIDILMLSMCLISCEDVQH